MLLVIFFFWISISISMEKNKILDNKFTKFISDISMEIYLSHMVIFRLIEKLHITKLFANNYAAYIATSVIVLIGVIIFAKTFNKIFIFLKNKIFIK